MNLSELINEDQIIINIEVKDKQDVLEALVRKIGSNVNSQEELIKDVLAREALVSTGLVNGIAIPHAQSNQVNKAMVAVATLSSDIEWETIDGSNVKVVILIVVPKNSQQGEHLAILASLAENLTDDIVCEALINSQSKQEIVRILEGK